MHRICVPGFIIQGTGQKRCPQSECGCKMHHRYGQGFRPNMQFASLCQMHGDGGREKMQRVATVAQPAQPNRTIFRLAQWRIGMLSRNGFAIKHAPPARFFILKLYHFITISLTNFSLCCGGIEQRRMFVQRQRATGCTDKANQLEYI